MDYLLELVARYPALTPVRDSIAEVYALLEAAFAAQHKLLVAGNGGSAADSAHLVGELMKGFRCPRPLPQDFIASLDALSSVSSVHPERFEALRRGIQDALPAVALTDCGALISAMANDVDASLVYAQQVYGLGCAGDVFLGISTSGNSANIVQAALCAKAKGMKVAALSGGTGGELARIADAAVIVPEKETYKVQEYHLPIYHTIALMLEEHFFI